LIALLLKNATSNWDRLFYSNDIRFNCLDFQRRGNVLIWVSVFPHAAWNISVYESYCRENPATKAGGHVEMAREELGAMFYIMEVVQKAKIVQRGHAHDKETDKLSRLDVQLVFSLTS
jgi:hypothetical protein